jgi:butyrate kinase
MKILAINPGSTSTKIAVYKDLHEDYTKTLRHSTEELSEYPRILEQYEFRKRIIIDALKEADLNISKIDVVVGRGGLLKPIPGGVYRVNDLLIEDLHKEILGEHASNLGGILAKEIASEAGKKVPAFIVDPVVVDEMEDIARLSGHPELPRVSIFHALNQKAVARRYAREHKLKYQDVNLIVAHLGGGVSVGAHANGRVIDVNNGLNGDGPYSPERTGTLPVGALTKLSYSGKYQFHELKNMITGKGGLVAYLKTNNSFEVEKRIDAGDEYAQLVYEGMAYQIAKEIGSLSTVFKGKLDAILLTGGLAKSHVICNWISERVSFIAPVLVYPGEDEMQALAESAYYALIGELPIFDYA